MAWYSIGTVTVTNGSTVVTGVGTDFVSNVAARDAFALVGGNANEIASVDSKTQLTLARPWLGANAGGQAYVVIPTVGIYVDLALRALNMLAPFQAVLDGIGQGLVPSGTLALPGVRFAADQDTGLARIGENILGLIAAGGLRLRVSAAGVDVPTSQSTAAETALSIRDASSGQQGGVSITGDMGGNRNHGLWMRMGYADGLVGATDVVATTAVRTWVNGSERMRVDAIGNLLVGVAAGSAHLFNKPAAQGAQIAGFFSTAASNTTMDIFVCGGGGGNAAATGVRLGSNTATGRSLNAGGTINSGGADYAEYMTKAAHCGTIDKGDVCGVTSEGLLTRTWADAVRFVVKSTDPNLVGGDTWAAHLPERPTDPGPAPIEPVAPAGGPAVDLPVEPEREDGEDDLDFIRRMAAYLVEVSAAVTAADADRESLAAYAAAAAAFPAAKAEHDAAVAVYEAALDDWEGQLEDARRTVDRIAFCGQVPVNVDADTLAACEAALADGTAVYLVAVSRGAGIAATAVRESDMTLPLYMRRLGAVWAVRDGRPLIDVQHG